MENQEMLKSIMEKVDRLTEIATMGQKSILDLNEAAAYLGYKPSYLYQLTRERTIPYYKPSKKIYFRKSELDEWMLRNRVKSRAEIGDAARWYDNHKSI